MPDSFPEFLRVVCPAYSILLMGHAITQCRRDYPSNFPCGMITFWPQCTRSTTLDKKTEAKNAAPASESGDAFGEQTLMLSELSTLQTLLWAEKSWPKTAGQGRVWGKTPSVSGNSFSPFLPLSNQNVSTCKTHSGESWIHKWLIPSLRCFPNMAPESAELLSA